AQQFMRPQSRLSAVRDVLHRFPAISPAAVLVLAVVAFGLINPRFIALTNLSLITQQVAIIGTLSIAQTIIILTAGIDLSVGSIMVFCSIVMAKLATAGGMPGVVALLLGFV